MYVDIQYLMCIALFCTCFTIVMDDKRILHPCFIFILQGKRKWSKETVIQQRHAATLVGNTFIEFSKQQTNLKNTWLKHGQGQAVGHAIHKQDLKAMLIYVGGS